MVGARNCAGCREGLCTWAGCNRFLWNYGLDAHRPVSELPREGQHNKTCQEPQFPPEIEAECQVGPNDPNVWCIPASIAEFAVTVLGFMERAQEKEGLAQMAERVAQRA